MSDEEIIEKLNKIVKEKETMYWFDEIKSALDLINRQRVEIERLKNEIQITKDAYTMLQTKNEIIKSEAIKEFAEKLKEIVKFTDDTYECWEIEGYIDNLVKETVGECDI